MDADREKDRLAVLAAQTHAVYERQAVSYDKSRDRTLFEQHWLQRATRDVAPGGSVLDLGCGAGAPIGEWIFDQGFALTGADFSQKMLAIFSARLPAAQAVLADMRSLNLGQQFEAIIGWGSFFHLTPDEQRRALPKIVQHLAPGGRLLLTVGPGAGEVTGCVGGDSVYHASLEQSEYAALLRSSGVIVEDFIPNDPDCNGFTLLLARAA